MTQFSYRWYDVRGRLPLGWSQEIAACAELATQHILTPTSVSSREAFDVGEIRTLTVDGDAVQTHLPWLFNLYFGYFRELAQLSSSEPVCCAKLPIYAVNLNVQRGSQMRYEAHVDTNPIQGILYLTSHPRGSGGELVVSSDEKARGMKAIDANAVEIFPEAGFFAVFDARRHPHYVKQLRNSSAIRISAPMNFYTPSAPEENRPTDLTPHLFGQKIRSASS